MKILLDNEEKRKFYSNFKNLKKISKLKRWGNKKISRANRIEYIEFTGKEIEEDRLNNFFNVLENRYQIALYCLEEIRKDCEIIEKNGTGIRELEEKMKDNNVDIEFVIKCEYFIFAISSCLDNIAQIINIIYNFGIPCEYVKISGIYKKIKKRRDNFSRYLLSEWKRWIDELRFIRNKMTHHQIINFSSHIDHQIKDEKAIFTKYCISVSNNRNKDLTKQLPTYFDEIIKNYKNLNSEFYKKVNSALKF